ncbi:MAG: hypothetical protein LBT04_07395 [Prevotellaceae bacterium]|jgi:hypothetical protein|nr:hypothetical protein [Prevotellaceae bacterium]
MKTKVFISIILLAFCANGFAQDKYYYSFAEKNYISVVDNKFIISAEKSASNRISDYLTSINAKTTWGNGEYLTPIFEANITLEELKAALFEEEGVTSIQPVYVFTSVDNSGKEISLELGITDQFLVKFLEDVTSEQIEEIYAKYDVSVLKEAEGYTTLTVKRNSDALEIANAFQESGLVEFSYPNFVSEAGAGNGRVPTGKVGEVYYYRGDEKIFLEERTDQILLSVETPQDADAVISFLQNCSMPLALGSLEENVLRNVKNTGVVYLPCLGKNGEIISNEVLTQIRSSNLIKTATYFLRDSNNVPYGITDKFTVKLKPDTDYAALVQLAAEYYCEIEKDLIVDDTVYFNTALSVTKETELNALQIANIFYETGLFEYSEPGFTGQWESPTAIARLDAQKGVIIISANSFDIDIDSNNEKLSYIHAYSIDGRCLFNKQYSGVSSASVHLGGHTGAYILKIGLQSGVHVSRKIILK